MNKFNLLTSAALLALLVSCKDKKDIAEPENQKPEAALKVEGEPGKLWNEVKVSVAASDSDGEIVMVDLYANNELVGSDGKSPYEFNWNTKDFEDGEVTLKAVVTDQMDAVTESVKQVVVMNTLISYDLHEAFLSMNPNLKFFTYITGKNKQVLYFDQVESLPYKVKVLRPGDFDDEQFDVHIVSANPLMGNLTTYTGLVPGKFAPLNMDKRGKQTGVSSMKFAKIPPHDYYSYAHFTGPTLKNTVTFKSNIYENVDLGYVYLRQGDKGLYKFVKGLTDGNAMTSLLGMSSGMKNREIAIKEPIDAFNIYVYGHTGADVNAPPVRLFAHTKSGAMPNYSVQYHTPDKETVFDHYSNVLNFKNKNMRYEMESYFSIITKPIKLKLNIDFKSHQLSKIDFKVSADPYDVLISTYGVNNNGFKFNWACYSRDENIVFPIIPAELTKAFSKFSNANIIFSQAWAYIGIQDYDHLKGYNDYLSTFAGRTGKTLKDGGKYNTITSQIINP